MSRKSGGHAALSGQRRAGLRAAGPAAGGDRKAGRQAALTAAGRVAFRNVSFAYEGENNPVLQNISSRCRPARGSASQGNRGRQDHAVSLLTRFYDPTAGRIRLDGVDLRDYRLADLRNQFAIVLQEPVLFSTSIAENIAYANPDATDEEVVAAARAANAHDVHHPPTRGLRDPGRGAWHAPLGRRAAAHLAGPGIPQGRPDPDPRRAHSSVDMKTEALIMEAMTRLMHDRTTFMIAHRLSTLANCDLRLQIEGGRLIEFDHQHIMGEGEGGNAAESLHRSKEIP